MIIQKTNFKEPTAKVKKEKRVLELIQRKFLSRISSAYKTVSSKALDYRTGSGRVSNNRKRTSVVSQHYIHC